MSLSDTSLASKEPKRWTERRADAKGWSVLLTSTKAVVAVLIVLGVALRLSFYLRLSSLSSDEAALALNLMHRSYSGLFDRLDVNQAAPAAFLILQRAAIGAFGAGPHVLRLLPLASGIAALFLFYPVARRFVGPWPAVFALLLFALSEPLLTYAATNKQYSVDVAVTLALYAVVLALPEKIGTKEALVLTVAGALAVWVSHAASFVLAGIGTVLLVKAAKGRRGTEFGRLSATIAVWLGSFGTAYLLTRSSVEHLQSTLSRGGQPRVLGGSAHPGLLQTYAGIARELFGISPVGHDLRSAIALLAIVLTIVGFVVMLRARPAHAGLLALPAVAAAVSAALDKYALFSRTFLFLVPALLMLAAYGGCVSASTRRPRLVGLAAAAALAVLTASATYATVHDLRSQSKGDTVRALRYLAQHAHKGDSLYLHLSAQLDFRYYLECGCFGDSKQVGRMRKLWPVRPPTNDRTFIGSVPPELIAGSETGRLAMDYRSDLAPVRGRERTWVLMLDPNSESQQALAAYLRQFGTVTDVFPRSNRSATASLALYDLR